MEHPLTEEFFTEYIEQKRKLINRSLEAYFTKILLGVKDRNISPIVEMLKNYTMRGGKRVRPILIVAGYELFYGQGDYIYDIATSIEMTQSFFLIHDDIMDRSDIRRGYPSFHKEMETMLGNIRDRNHIAMSLAIVAGDLAVDYSYDAIIRSEAPIEKKMDALEQITEIIKITGYGEGLDVYTGSGYVMKISDLIRLHLRKTAKYTVEGPLIMGASIAGEKGLRELSAYGNLVGLAFQLHDDVIGIFGTEKELGKSPKSDVNEGKQTLLIIKALERSGEKDRKFIWECLTNGNISDSDFEKLKDIIVKTGSLAYSRWLIEKFVENGKRRLDKIDGKKEVKVFLNWFADYLTKRNH